MKQGKPIYLDNNASTPLAPEVIKRMKEVLDNSFGNPSSTHYYGLHSKQIVEESRDDIAKMLNCHPEEIIFTSGGSESNNFAITGIARQFPGSHIITSVIEHPSVSKVCDQLEKSGYEITRIPVDENCLIDIKHIEDAIQKNTKLITIMLANNETGVIQPLEKIGKIAKKYNILIHTDAVQAAGKIKIDIKQLDVSLLTIAAHKMNGPIGVGALYIKNGIKLKPFILGAGHEYGKRAGTENVLEIAGFGTAAKIFSKSHITIIKNQQSLVKYFYNRLIQTLPDIKINGCLDKQLPNTINIYFPGSKAHDILNRSSIIAASPGAACHTGSIKPSQVLKKMGFSDERASGSIRFSMGRMNTKNEMDIASQAIIDAVHEIQGLTSEKSFFKDSYLANSSASGCSCKLSPELLYRMLNDLPKYEQSEDFNGFQHFDDASIYFLNDKQALLSSVDFFTPIVDNPYNFGQIAAANALSDIYAMGGKPLFANNIVAFPEGEIEDSVLKQILQGAQNIAETASIPILGGHSIKSHEMKYGMAVTGIVDRDKIWKNSGASDGDILILTKPLGIGIMCEAIKKQLLTDYEKTEVISTMLRLNKNSAEIISQFNISACTDVTGFGLIGHLAEMMKASQTSAQIYIDKIPLLKEIKKICRLGIVNIGYLANQQYFGNIVDCKGSVSANMMKILYDPQTSGGLLLSINQCDSKEVLSLLNKNDKINAWQIGHIINKKEKLIEII